MRSDELFGALIRALGIWETVSGLTWIPNIFGTFGQYRDVATDLYTKAMWANFGSSTARIVFGCVLFFGANLLVRLAYPRRTMAE